MNKYIFKYIKRGYYSCIVFAHNRDEACGRFLDGEIESDELDGEGDIDIEDVDLLVQGDEDEDEDDAGDSSGSIGPLTFLRSSLLSDSSEQRRFLPSIPEDDDREDTGPSIPY